MNLVAAAAAILVFIFEVLVWFQIASVIPGIGIGIHLIAIVGAAIVSLFVYSRFERQAI